MRPETAETPPPARSPADGRDGADGEEQRDHVEPDEAALLVLVVDDVERVEDRLHAGIGAPQRNAEPEEKAEGEPAVALGRDARDLLAPGDRASRPGRCRTAIDKMLADRADIGEQRVGRNAGGDRRKQGDQANRTRRRRRAPADGRSGFPGRCGQRCPSSRARESATAHARRGRGRARRRGCAARSAAPAPASRAAETEAARAAAPVVLVGVEARRSRRR